MWFDDIVYDSTDEDFGRWFEAEVGKQFTVGDFDPLAWFLGIAFKADQDDLTLSHKLYISNLLTKFVILNCKIASTPLPEKCARSKDDHLAMTTRPDLAFAPHLSRFLNNHSVVHWQAAKHVLRYHRGTEDVGIAYWRNCKLAHLTGYSDADYASCKYDRKSVTGFCFSYVTCAIWWSVKKQTCVATSTTEAEVHALSEAAKEALHTQGILECIGETKRTTILSDSQLCLALVSKDDGSYPPSVPQGHSQVQEARNRLEVCLISRQHGGLIHRLFKDWADSRRYSIRRDVQPYGGVRSRWLKADQLTGWPTADEMIEVKIDSRLDRYQPDSELNYTFSGTCCDL